MKKLERLELENKILRRNLTKINSIVYDPELRNNESYIIGSIQHYSSEDTIEREISNEIFMRRINMSKTKYQYDDNGNEYYVDDSGNRHYTRDEG